MATRAGFLNLNRWAFWDGTLCLVPKGEYLQYGGLALIEAIMMRSPNHYSVACRAPNGEIVVKTESIEKTWIGRQKWLKLPFLRGSLAILDSMAIGNRAMKFSAEVQMDKKYAKPEDAETEPKPERPHKGLSKLYYNLPEAKRAKIEAKLEKHAIVVAVVIGLGMGFFVFNVIPNSVAELTKFAGVKDGTVINYIAEFIKIFVFLGYVWGISFLPDIRKVFQYHGAEHKAINALEAEQPLTMENCQAQTRLHPRCGTSFAIIVLLVGLVFMPLVPRYPITGKQGNMLLDVPVRLLVEIAILPIISGISYELLRIAGRLRNQTWVMMAFKPGLWTQLITTKEPEPEHVEVAITALKEVLKAEGEPEPGSEPDPVTEPIPTV